MSHGSNGPIKNRLLVQRSSDVCPNAHLWFHTYFTFVKGGSGEVVWCGGSCEWRPTNISPFNETYLLMAFFRYCCSHRISGFTHTSLFVFSLALIRRKNRKDISPRCALSADKKTNAELGESDFPTLPCQFDREGRLRATSQHETELFTEQVKAGSCVWVSTGKHPKWY